jgi:hypothetical protein
MHDSVERSVLPRTKKGLFLRTFAILHMLQDDLRDQIFICRCHFQNDQDAARGENGRRHRLFNMKNNRSSPPSTFIIERDSITALRWEDGCTARRPSMHERCEQTPPPVRRIVLLDAIGRTGITWIAPLDLTYNRDRDSRWEMAQVLTSQRQMGWFSGFVQQGLHTMNCTWCPRIEGSSGHRDASWAFEFRELYAKAGRIGFDESWVGEWD